jgi:hypothetical protein
MNADTIFIFCFILLGLLVLVKRNYPEPFRLFIQLPFNDTFIRLYDSKLRSWRFTLWGFLATGVFSFSYLIEKLSFKANLDDKLGFNCYFFIISVLLLKQILRLNAGFYLFKRKKASKLISSVATSFLAYQGLLSFLFTWLYLAEIVPYPILESLYFALLLTLQILSYISVIKKTQHGNIRFGIGFILYLCALEMSPLTVLLLMVIK